MSQPDAFATVHHFGQKSQFKFYSIGYAAENKPLGTKWLSVNPSEILPYVDGEVKEMPTPYQYSGTGPEGESYAGTVTTDMVIKCQWLAHNSNRYTAPDVRRGERILIYVYGDSDKYYWVTTGFDDHLRKLETASWVFSDTQDESDTTLRPDNTYSFEVSTHKGTITLQTAKSNGEPFAYIEQLNAKEGEYHFTDDINNYCFLKSAEHHWKKRNASNAYRELIQGRVYTNAPTHYRLTSGPTFIYADNRCIEGEAPDHITWDTGGCSYGGGGSEGGYESVAKDHIDMAVDNRWSNSYNATSHDQLASQGSEEDSRYGKSNLYASTTAGALRSLLSARASPWTNDQANTRIYANNDKITLKTTALITENIEGQTTTEKTTEHIKTTTPKQFLSLVGSTSTINQTPTGVQHYVNNPSGSHSLAVENNGTTLATVGNDFISLRTKGDAAVNLSGDDLYLTGEIYIAPWGGLFRNKIQSMDDSRANLQSQISALSSRINSLQNGLSELSGRVGAIESQL